MHNNIDKFISSCIDATKNTIENTVAQVIQSHSCNELIKQLLTPVNENLLTGKFIRAKMCILGAITYNPDIISTLSTTEKTIENLRWACSAIELYHASALVHDDIIDKSETRRGTPSAPTAFKHLHKVLELSGSDTDYCLNSSILLGDLLLSLASKNITCIHTENIDNYRQIMSYFNDITAEVAVGQYYDLYASHIDITSSEGIDQNLIMDILKAKSANYSVLKPFVLGMLVAGYDISKPEDKLFEALQNWGIAFQLKDDELGIFGDSKVTGKNNYTDILEGKRTMLMAIALNSVTDEQKNLLLQVLTGKIDLHTKDLSGAKDNQNILDSNCQYIRSIIRHSEAFDTHRKIIDQLYLKGKNAISSMDINPQLKQYLLDFGNHLINRNK